MSGVTQRRVKICVRKSLRHKGKFDDLDVIRLNQDKEKGTITRPYIILHSLHIIAMIRPIIKVKQKMEKSIVGLSLYSFACKKGGMQQIAATTITIINRIPQIIVSITPPPTIY